MKAKLHWKLTLLFCSIFLLGLFGGYLYLTFQLKDNFLRNLENNLRHQLLLGRDFLELSLNSQKTPVDPDIIADEIGKQQELRVTIINRDGTVIGDSDLDSVEIKKTENHLNRPEIQEAANKGIGVSKRYSYTIKKYLLYMAVPFGKEKNQGFLRYAVQISYIEMLEGKIEKIIIVALLMAFLFSLIFTLLVSIIVSKPLSEMARIAKAMASGDFSKKPSIYSKDEIGKLAMALSNMADEIKGKMEKIKQEGAKLDAVLNSMFEGIMLINEKGRILLANPSIRKLFFIDLPPETKTPVEVIRNIEVQDIVDNILKNRQKHINEEITITRPEEKILLINGVPIVRDDILEGAILVFHDITELRRLERIRQDFVANVSHELRTPISSIKGYSETLLDGAIEDKEVLREFIGIIYQDSNRLANLIDDLLDLSKIESGKMKMAKAPLDIKPILDRCLVVLERSIKEKKLSVNLNIMDGIPKIMADDKRIAQVLLNLLDNAVKYTPVNGLIEVNISLNEDFIQVEIKDTGIGIPEKDLARIFERFYRVDKARSRELGGTGLGLSIVKNIVLAHNGQVWVDSEPGKGSSFKFTIPKA